MTVTVADIVQVMHKFFPPQLAQDWDRVGLIVGELTQEVERVGFAVDPCEKTVREAIERNAQMLITHHPLYLRGTSSVAAITGKGRWVHQLIKNDCALFAAHTNADIAFNGSADALANLLQLENQRPLVPVEQPDFPMQGIGKVGDLPLTMTLEELAYRVKALIPQTPAGITIGGELDRIVKRVALSPGSGDSFLQLANEFGADVYITADLRHHPASDHLWNNGCALIGLTHFASEWPLLPNMRKIISAQLDVDTYISTIITDPWVARI